MAEEVYCLKCERKDGIRFRRRLTEYYRIERIRSHGQLEVGKLADSVANLKDKPMIVCIHCDLVWNPKRYLNLKREKEYGNK